MNCLPTGLESGCVRGAPLTLNGVGRQQCGGVVWTGQPGHHRKTSRGSTQTEQLLIFDNSGKIKHILKKRESER